MQNGLLYVRRDYLEAHAGRALYREWQQTDLAQLSVVHPLKYLETVGMLRTSLRQTVSALPAKVVGAARRILFGPGPAPPPEVTAAKAFLDPVNTEER